MFHVCAIYVSLLLIVGYEYTRTLRHNKPQCSLMGPSIPNATPFHHQKVLTIEATHTQKVIHFVFSDRRRALKMK